MARPEDTGGQNGFPLYGHASIARLFFVKNAQIFCFYMYIFIKPARLSDWSTLAYNATLFVLTLAATNGLFSDIHQVTMDTGSAGKWRYDAIGVSVLLHFFPFDGLFVQDLTVLDRDLAVEVGAHLAGQLGHGEETLEHLIQLGVLLGRDLKVGAFIVLSHQLLDLMGLDLSVEVAVALVAADD